MCERHSQAPPTLASPKSETTEREEGRSGLIANTDKVPSHLVQRYPEPHARKRQRVALRRRMSCGEAKQRKIEMYLNYCDILFPGKMTRT